MGLFDGTPLERPVLCDRCQLPLIDCKCPEIVQQPEEVPASKQKVVLSLENRKKGKQVSVVRGLRGTKAQLQTILTALKNHCGAGGTLQDEEIVELQGDQLCKIADFLEKQGMKVKGPTKSKGKNK